MALGIALQLAPRRTHSHPYSSSSSSSSSSGGGGKLSPGVIIAIIASTIGAIFLVIFALVLCNSYQNASRLKEQKGTATSNRKIILRALLLSLTLGIVAFCGCCVGPTNRGGECESGSAQPQTEYMPIGDSAQTSEQCVADGSVTEQEGKKMGTREGL